MSQRASPSKKSTKSAESKKIPEAPIGDQKRKISSQGDKVPNVIRAKPKKAMHPYLCYVTQNVKTIKTEEMAYSDAVKKCAETWNKMDDIAK